jgi:hypothetical protein
MSVVERDRFMNGEGCPGCAFGACPACSGHGEDCVECGCTGKLPIDSELLQAGLASMLEEDETGEFIARIETILVNNPEPETPPTQAVAARLDMDDRKVVKWVQRATVDDNVRPSLRGFQVTADEFGTELVATNGHSLHVAEMGKQYPLLPGLYHLTALGNGIDPAEGTTLSGAFPDWRSVIPCDPPVASMTIDPALLRDALAGMTDLVNIAIHKLPTGAAMMDLQASAPTKKPSSLYALVMGKLPNGEPKHWWRPRRP